MSTVAHTLIIRCDTLEHYNWCLEQLAIAQVNDLAHPIQTITPFAGQKRINVVFVPQDNPQGG